jgi:hypothetical protein
MSANIQYDEIGNDLYNLKNDLEKTLNIMSLYCYKDLRGDCYIPRNYEEINKIKNALDILQVQITDVQNKIKQL